MSESGHRLTSLRRFWLLGVAGMIILAALTWEAGLYRGLLMDRSVMNVDRIQPDQAERRWAEKMEVAGVPNLHKVSDDLYRGAQPTKEGVQALKALGIRTIVNLRTLHSDRRRIEDANDLSYAQITTQPWSVTDDDAIRFLKIVTDPNRTPVFVHCQRGADRTGTLCATYRMVVQGWTLEQALQEMTEGGFGFYPGWEDLVEYLRGLNVQEIRARAGVGQ